MAGLLEKFKVEMPEHIEDANVIGIDFGDGECCAYNVLDENGKGKIFYLDENYVKRKVPNVLWVTEKGIRLDDKGSGGEKYYNFKRCPGTEGIKAAYRFEDNRKSEYTYEKLMQMAFNCLVDMLFEFNGELDRQKRTIIFVGRPAGAYWEKHEEEYAQILKSGLDNKYRKTTDIVIVAESTAAYVRETNPSRGEKRVKSNEIALVIDIGSSTLDVTMIVRGKKGKEYSRQFGGHAMEEMMFDEINEAYKKKNKNSGDIEFMANDFPLLKLRRKKEEYFGDDGKEESKENPSGYTIDYMNNGKPDKYRLNIDKEFMDKALNQRGIVVGSNNPDQPNETMPSWYGACRKIFEDVKGRMNIGERGIQIDRLIMTGGVSVVQKVQKLAEEVFGIQPARTKFPSYSVAEGLAYIAYIEYKKQIELKAVKEEVRREFDTQYLDIKSCISLQAAEKIWPIVKATMKEWSESPKDTTLDVWYKEYFESEYTNNMSTSVVWSGAVYWYQQYKLNDIIHNCLNNRFKEMFPDYNNPFTFCVSSEAVRAALEGKKISIHYRPVGMVGILKSLVNVWHLFWRTGLSGKQRKDFYNKTLQRENEIKENLKKDYAEHLDANVNQRIHDEILKAIEPELKNYTESLTPYFNLTCKV